MISPEAQKFADLLRSSPTMAELPLADQRAAGEHAEDLAADPVGVTYAPLDDAGVRGLWALPTISTADRTILYVFGAGTSSRPCRRDASSAAISRSPRPLAS